MLVFLFLDAPDLTQQYFEFFYFFLDSACQADESDNSDDAPSAAEEFTDSQAMIEELEKTKALLHATQAELEDLKRESQTASKEANTALAHLQEEFRRQKEEAASGLKIYKFGIERFSTDDDAIKFYTGFCSYKHFLLFYNLIRPTAEKMTYCYATGVLENRPHVRAMQLIDELFMFLVRIKLGLFQQDLAHRFNLHISSVSRKITTWANYLYFFLGSQPIWPSRADVCAKMPGEFKKLYPTTRVILDCTEFFVETPSSLLLQSQLYSSYKSNTTLKGLIGISPHGAITFVSSLYTGAISDKEITRCSGILDLLEAGDSVMADKGFDIEDLLREKEVDLNIPPFLESRTQFSAAEVQKTKMIAKVRIHVERAIKRIKEFHIFDSDVPLSMLGSINQVYTVACLLTNFQGPLILNGDNF